jgi:pentapeptide MXKDX repeat protein
MKKILIATTALTLMCGSAFAQGTTGPAAQQDNMTKPGMNNGSMEKGSMNKGSMNSGTTGMNADTKSSGPNGSAGDRPTAKGGPSGQASKDEAAPK